MPNWCMNNITVSHDDPAMVDRFENAYNNGKTCEEFLPVPEGYYDDERWYDWCVDNWGTKWDFGADPAESLGLKATRVGNQVSVSFDSAWSPPIGLYETLVELGYNVRATYWEPGMAFCGIWDNGDDNYVEYSDAEKPEEVIPVALWNDYNMDEFLEETEADA